MDHHRDCVTLMLFCASAFGYSFPLHLHPVIALQPSRSALARRRQQAGHWHSTIGTCTCAVAVHGKQSSAPRLLHEAFSPPCRLCSPGCCARVQLSVQHINATFPPLPNGTYPRQASVRNIDM